MIKSKARRSLTIKSIPALPENNTTKAQNTAIEASAKYMITKAEILTKCRVVEDRQSAVEIQLITIKQTK